ncbi:uncharacterized protein LOC111620221 [Centruroides sculpturatus]|uniref:uncharacterized protein LOC111620221 n=1 Tax=Centruroides sculpturatus TaxID=218467 RepID=UPI000C6D4E2C|nr:uncharacterized protein LOC111620221 [Centruroides sculpturatus]
MDTLDYFIQLVFEFHVFYFFNSGSRIHKLFLSTVLCVINIAVLITSPHLLTVYDGVFTIDVLLLISLTISLLWIAEVLRRIKITFFPCEKCFGHDVFNVVLMIFQVFTFHYTSCWVLKGVCEVSIARKQQLK